MRWSLLVCLLAGSVAASAQGTEDVLRPNGNPNGNISSQSTSHAVVFGLEAGLNINFLSQGISRDVDIQNSVEDVLKSGTGVSPEFGLFADVPLSSGVGIQFRAAYDAKSVGATQSDGIAEYQLAEGQGHIQGVTVIYGDATIESNYSLRMQAATIAVLGRFNLGENLFATLGPIINIAMGDVKRKDRLTVLGPDDAYFFSDYEGNPVQTKEITRETSLAQSIFPQNSTVQASTYSTMRVGLEVGLGYRFMLSKSIYLAPNLRYQYFFTPLTETYTSLDNSKSFSEGQIPITFNSAKLNSLALIVQLGFTL